MGGTLFVAAATASLCCYGLLESRWHNRNLARIPIRIHVNGTRGKSGVTRLIAAGLRAGGIRTFAKTTGTKARAILPDGTEYPVFRPARTNVIEQVRMVRAAANYRAEAIVIECMALQPALQSLCELKFVQSTHGVITNARPDHLDVMGPTAADVARSMAATIPIGGKMFTAEQLYLPVFQRAAADRHSQVHAVSDEDIADVSWDELERFSYVEHPENVVLALQVCADLGISRSVALEGMWQATPDPGVMRLIRSHRGNRQLVIVNGFAANDPESTGKIWHMMVGRFERHRRLAVINCREDRPDRSIQLAIAVADWTPADHYLLTGTGVELFRRTAIGRGLSSSQLTSLDGLPVDQIADEIWRHTNRSTMVMGMGNTSGPGLGLIDFFQKDVQPARVGNRAKRTTFQLEAA